MKKGIGSSSRDLGRKIHRRRRIFLLAFTVIFLLSATWLLFCAIHEDSHMNIDSTIATGEYAENNNEETIVRYIRSIAMFIFAGTAIYVVRFLYENHNEDFFTSVIGLLAAVLLSGELLNLILVYFIHSYSQLWTRVALVLTFISFCLMFSFFLGFYPMSTRKLIKAMVRQLEYHEKADSDWIHEGEKEYQVEVARMYTIPWDTSTIRSTETTEINRAITKFLKGNKSSRKPADRMILIGGFGSGKSTALFQNAQRMLGWHFCHTGQIPVYIKLRDWLSDTDLGEIRNNGWNVLNKNKEIRDIHTKRLCELITGKTEQSTESEQSEEWKTVYNVLIALHEQRRLVYIFDGFNELLQRKGINTENLDDELRNEQFARNLSNFLYRFASGNRCILSMCELPGIITSQSIMLGDSQERYLVYAITGVRLGYDEIAKLNQKNNGVWLKKLIHNVALYRMANAGNQTKAESIYELMHNYVNKQLRNVIVDMTMSDSCEKAMEAIIRQNIGEGKEEQSAFLHLPYSGLKLTQKDDKIGNYTCGELFQAMSNTRLFYIEHEDNADNERYHPSHILIWEYMLAQYARSRFFSKSIEKKDKEITSFVDFFYGAKDDKPDFLEQPQLRAVYSMVSISCVEEKMENIAIYNEAIYNKIININSNDLDSKYRTLISFLMLLSTIANDLRALNIQNTDVLIGDTIRKGIVRLCEFADALSKLAIHQEENQNENKPAASRDDNGKEDELYNIMQYLQNNKRENDKIECIPMAIWFSLVKLLPNGQQKEKMKGLLPWAMKYDWRYLSIQREILDHALLLSSENDQTGEAINNEQ